MEDFLKDIEEKRNELIEKIKPIIDQIVIVRERDANAAALNIADDTVRKQESKELLAFYSKMLNDVLGLTDI